MKLTALFISLLLAQTCLAQFKITKLDKKTLPKSIQYTGKIVQALRWNDNTGNNIVILTETDKTPGKDSPDNGSDGALYAYHYMVAADSIRQTWKVYDYIKDCPVDMFLFFIEKAFAVTDLDKNGKAEVWMMYKNSCQGDVSPVGMKIIMYEDNKKFAVRGTTRIQVSEKEYSGGDFSFDDAFKKAPLAFRQYAEKLWSQYKEETWDK